MGHLKLGEILLQQNLITESQLQKAIEEQQETGERIGETLVRLGFINEENIVSALAKQLLLPFYSEKSELLKPQESDDLESLVPYEFAKRNVVLPISKNMNSLTCAVYDPLDYLLIDNLKKLSGCEVNLIVATRSDILTAIDHYYQESKTADNGGSLLGEAIQSTYANDTQIIADDSDPTALSPEAQLSLDALIAKAEEAPVVKLVDLIIRQAIEERASDIHIEPYKDLLKLRYRIDGSLYEIPPPARHLHLPIVSRIKILAKLDIAEKRLPQDGSISARLENRTVELRISTVPTVWGEKVVIRILDKDAVPLELAQLGFDNKQLDLIRKSVKSPHGLFFVTGPTGSGKSTTLYASINEIADPKKNIMTIEDPVEYRVDGVNQVAIKNDIGLTFASALRAFLRQDPDVIMVGEVRDLETAQICVRAALTGHLVLSSLHTNDAASALSRLLDIGVEPYLLTPSIIIIIAQRLARKLCPKCKEAYEPTPEQLGGVIFKSDLIYRPKGCAECNQTGYRGRMVISEVMAINDEIRELISQNASYSNIQNAAKKNSMDTLLDNGKKRVEEGLTSFDEILRVTRT